MKWAYKCTNFHLNKLSSQSAQTLLFTHMKCFHINTQRQKNRQLQAYLGEKHVNTSHFGQEKAQLSIHRTVCGSFAPLLSIT